MQLPQPSIVIRACRNQVRRIGTESAIPDPALMTLECAFKLERLRSLVIGLCLSRDRNHGFKVLDFPDLGGVVGRASGQVLNVGRKENTGNVVLVCGEMGDWDEGSLFAVLEEVPDVDVALEYHVSSFEGNF
jgi:hypothetical protein